MAGTWFIERLLTNSVQIHSEGTESEMLGYLLTLEKKINELAKLGILTDEEIVILNEMLDNKTITQLSKENRQSRVTTANKLDALTDKISMYLGGIYTDEGYLDYMKRRYKLNDEQVEQLREKITGNYKRFYLR